MSVKKLMNQLERYINYKFPEFDAKFYSNRGNFYIQMGLDNLLFGYSNFKHILE